MQNTLRRNSITGFFGNNRISKKPSHNLQQQELTFERIHFEEEQETKERLMMNMAMDHEDMSLNSSRDLMAEVRDLYLQGLLQQDGIGNFSTKNI